MTKAATLAATRALAEAIRDLGEVPSGHLYAHVMGHMSLETYTGLIWLLKRSGLVEENYHLLTWNGPKAKTMDEKLATSPNADTETTATLGRALGDSMFPPASGHDRETFKEMDARVKREMYEEHIEHAPIVVDTPIAPVVDFSHQPAIPLATVSRSSKMILTFVKNSRNGKRAIYSGAALSLAFPIALFVDKTAPATITDLSVFAEKVVKTPKAKLTKEERKALPKPTLAERIAKREAQLAKDKAKLAASPSM